MTAPPYVTRAAAVKQRVDGALIKLAELRLAATAMTDYLGDVERDVVDLGTGHPEVYAAVKSVRVAIEHVDNAWRCIDYATRNLVEGIKP